MDTDDSCELLKEMAEVFKALGDVNRMWIISILASNERGKICVTELATRLGITQPAVSRHLRTLRYAGIVEPKKEGNLVYYTFNRDAMVRYKGNIDYLFGCVLEKCDRLETEG